MIVRTALENEKDRHYSSASEPASDIRGRSDLRIPDRGQPTGVAIGPDEEADNFTAFTQTVPLVAAFRCSDDTCPGDVVPDVVVDVADFLALLASWGVCACSADLDGDGTVDVTDFLELLAHWGPCV